MSVLIVSYKDDPHPTRVIQLLNEMNVSVFRLNTDTFITDYDLTWNSDSLEDGFILRNIHNNLSIKESEIKSVWFRRSFKPVAVRFPVDDEIKNHNISEALGFLYYLYNELYDKYSVGNYVYDDIADSKIRQIKLAKKIGFLVPETCYSNRKDEILRLSNKYPWVVIKSIKNDFILTDEGNRHVFFAQKVKSQELKNIPEEAFAQTINFIQPYVEKAFELRVTIVGDEVFACKLESQSMGDESGKIDWRQGVEEGMKHSIFELPKTIADMCKKYLHEMHLNFGCFDFIVTPKNEYVFLECNPNGQWLWIEMFTGMNISKGIARCLASREETIVR